MGCLRVALFVSTRKKGGDIMKKVIFAQAFILTSLLTAAPVFAQTADVTPIKNFIISIINIVVSLGAVTAAGFFVWGGFGYITSSGNPESLDRAKNTLKYSAIGLAIVLAAFVIIRIVVQVATGAFGTGTSL